MSAAPSASSSPPSPPSPPAALAGVGRGAAGRAGAEVAAGVVRVRVRVVVAERQDLPDALQVPHPADALPGLRGEHVLLVVAVRGGAVGVELQVVREVEVVEAQVVQVEVVEVDVQAVARVGAGRIVILAAEDGDRLHRRPQPAGHGGARGRAGLPPAALRGRPGGRRRGPPGGPQGRGRVAATEPVQDRRPPVGRLRARGPVLGGRGDRQAGGRQQGEARPRRRVTIRRRRTPRSSSGLPG